MKADRKRELVAIHRDTTERERKVVTQVNHQLLVQIKVLQKVQQRFIELGAREILADSSSEVNQHPAAPTDLRFKLNKICSKAIVLHEDPKNFQADSSRKRAKGIGPQLQKKMLSNDGED